MPRLFVAIDLPDAHKEALVALRDPALPGRWTPTDQYHLTLRFIGDVDERRADAVEQALATLRRDGFSLRGSGLGVFPSIRKPRVLFAAVDRAPGLTALHAGVEQALRPLGLNDEGKPFHPHVTLARLRGADARSVRAYLRARQAFTLDPFEVTRWHLYESLLRPQGALHTRRATFALSNTTRAEQDPR